MKKPLVIVIASALMLAAMGALLLIPARQKNAPAGPVAATIFPIHDIARTIAAGAFEVTLVLPPGAEPHSFEPTPSVTRALADAQVVYAVGYGLDDWVDDVIPPTAEKMTVDDGIALRASVEPFHDEGAAEEEEEHGPTDPHYWLSVPNAKIIAANIAADLKKRFPEHAAIFEANAAKYAADLDALDAEIRTELAKVGNGNLITFHDAWHYFAAEYDLRIAGTFEPSPNREPTPRYLQELEKAVKRSGTRTLYTEPLFSSAAISSFASDNGLKLAQIDDIGGTAGRGNYIELMRYNAQTIAANQ